MLAPVLVLVALALALAACAGKARTTATDAGFEVTGVGEPCVTGDESQPNFSSFAVTELNVETASPACATGLCLVNHFQGRVSCKYGQTDQDLAAGTPRCLVPGSAATPINVPVLPQLVDRQADKVVYCSCRCDGPDPNARYCACPDGYACTHLFDDLGLPGSTALAGSYCVKDRTQYDPRAPQPNGVCVPDALDPTQGSCGPVPAP